MHVVEKYLAYGSIDNHMHERATLRLRHEPDPAADHGATNHLIR